MTWGRCGRSSKVRYYSVVWKASMLIALVLYTYLAEIFTFRDEDIITLTDDKAEVEAGTSRYPTRDNIVIIFWIWLPTFAWTDYLIDAGGLWLHQQGRGQYGLRPILWVVIWLFCSDISDYTQDSGHADQHEEPPSENPIEEDGLKECEGPYFCK